MPAKCHVCGYENVEGDEFCEECGVNVQTENPLEEKEEGEEQTLEEAPEAPKEADGPTCPSCSYNLPADTNFCNKCGTPIKEAGEEGDKSSCPSCRGPIEAEDAFCNACGASLDEEEIGGEAESNMDALPIEDALFKLVVVTGHEKDKVFPAGKEDISLGRGPDNDIILDTDGYVSSRHTRVFQEDGEFFVEDLGSTNGTFLRVKSKSKLEPGDEIKIGQSIFRFEV